MLFPHPFFLSAWWQVFFLPSPPLSLGRGLVWSRDDEPGSCALWHVEETTKPVHHFGLVTVKIITSDEQTYDTANLVLFCPFSFLSGHPVHIQCMHSTYVLECNQHKLCFFEIGKWLMLL